jgi:hypothetical protein
VEPGRWNPARQSVGGSRRPPLDRPEDERFDERLEVARLEEERLDEERVAELEERDGDEDRLDTPEERELLELEREELARGGGAERGAGCTRRGSEVRWLRGSTRGGGALRGSTRSLRRGSTRSGRGWTRSERSDGSTVRNGVEPGVFERTPSITRRGTE